MSKLGAEKRLHQFLAAHFGEVDPERAQAALNALTGHLNEMSEHVLDWFDINGRVNQVAFSEDGSTVAFNATLHVTDRLHEIRTAKEDRGRLMTVRGGTKTIPADEVRGLHFPFSSNEPAYWYRFDDRFIAEWGPWSFDIPEPSVCPMFWLDADGKRRAAVVSDKDRRYTEFLQIDSATKYVREKEGKKIELVGVCAGEAVFILTSTHYEHWTSTYAGHNKFIHWGDQVSKGTIAAVRGVVIRKKHLMVSWEDIHRRNVCSEMRQGSGLVEVREIGDTYVSGERLFSASGRFMASVTEYLDYDEEDEPRTKSLPPGFELFECHSLANDAYLLVVFDNSGGINRPNKKFLYVVTGGKRSEEPIETTNRFRVFHGQLAIEEESDGGHELRFVGREERLPLLCGIDRLVAVKGGIMGWHQVGRTLYLIHYPIS